MDLTLYNPGQNICRRFHFLARFLSTTSDTELDYYHKKKSVRVASRVPKRLKPFQILGNLEISRKSLKYLDPKVSIQLATPKPVFEVF